MDVLLNTGLTNQAPTKNTRVPAGVVKNADGSISTVRTMSFTDDDGYEVLIPTVASNGTIMSDNEAIDHYYKTKQHYGRFISREEAKKAADRLHLEHEKMLNNPILRVGLN